MSVHTAFRYEEEGFVPFDLPMASEQTWMDALEHENFRKDVSLTLGHPHGGLRLEVHQAEHPTAPHQEFLFLAVIRIGETAHPVFCRELPQLLGLLQEVAPLITLEVKFVGEELSLPELQHVLHSRFSRRSGYACVDPEC